MKRTKLYFTQTSGNALCVGSIDDFYGDYEANEVVLVPDAMRPTQCGGLRVSELRVKGVIFPIDARHAAAIAQHPAA
jgi:hypothetical protein